MAKERSIFYHLRRKGQVLALKTTSPEFMSKFYFKHELGYTLNLKEPKTFNEKLQWLKLYEWPNNPLAIKCSDKFAVQEYMKSLGKANLLNEQFFVWDNVDDIDWNKLPNQFVLKCNHGCNYNILCYDKSTLNEKETKRKLRRWMSEDFSMFNAEPHYGMIPHKIVCEKFLGNDIINYNIYCFNGKVTFISVAGGLGNGVGEWLTYYNPDGTKAYFKNKLYPTSDTPITKPLKEMEKIAEDLSKPFPMVRVDIFDVDGKFVLSEFTFTPGGGLIPFDPISADKELGSMLDITKEMNNRKNE